MVCHRLFVGLVLRPFCPCVVHDYFNLRYIFCHYLEGFCDLLWNHPFIEIMLSLLIKCVLDTILAQVYLSRSICFHHESLISSVHLELLCPECVKLLQFEVTHANLIKSEFLTVELANYGYAMIVTLQFKIRE